MKKSLVSMVMAGLVFAIGSGTASAQDAPPRIIPVDLFACTYNEGKGPADLDTAADAWNAYVDDSDQKDAYAAWTLTKHYAGEEQDFDVIWLGAWKDGNAMGAGWQNYLETGGDAAAGFASVMDCGAPNNFGSVRHRAPPGGTPGNGVMVFSDCTLADGVTSAMHAVNMKKWVAVLDEAEVESGIFHWYPIFGGGGDTGFDFKSISVFADHVAFGDMYQKMTNGGLYRKNRAIFRDSVSCDVARVYNAQNRRSAELRD
jgi:hypothetical protein